MDENNHNIELIIVFYLIGLCCLIIFDIIIKIEREKNYNKSMKELKKNYQQFYNNKFYRSKINKKMKKEFYNKYILPKKNN